MWRQSRSTARTWRGWLGAASPDDGELELLRAALVPGVEAHAAWMRWRATHALDRAPSRSNEILSAVGAALPEEVLGKDSLWLRRLRRQIWVQNQLLLRSLGEALVLLTEHGVPTTVVKGAALVSDVYPELGLRAMGDTDFVVGPDHFDRALDMLTSDGWTLNNEWFHAADLVDAQGYETDVHRWPLFPRFTRTVETGWRDRCVETVIAGTLTHRLALPDELVLAVAHGLLGRPNASLVRWPLDVAAIRAAADDADFWTDVVRSASEVGISPVVGAGLGFCREELALDVPSEVVAELTAAKWDRWLAYQWWRRRHGSYPPMRIRRYVDLERAGGRQPTLHGYAGRRWENLRRNGLTNVTRHRLRNLCSLGVRPG
jgi:hypothetical protein